VNSFDSFVLHAINEYARRSYLFDRWMTTIVDLDIVKGAVFVSLLCWFWFAPSERRANRREIIVATVIGCVVAVFVGRLMGAFFPYRTRPILNPALGFIWPYGSDPNLGADPLLRPWSAFPSDHAMFFGTLVAGVFFMSRVAGAITSVYAAVMIGFPRLYTGEHYPTDMLGGAVLGVLIGILVNTDPVRRLVAPRVCRLVEAHPGTSYALAFFVAFQVATMFWSARVFAHLSWCTFTGGQSTRCALAAPSARPGPSPSAIPKGAGSPALPP
jgi:undecaprenyl-diphosphatase